MKKLVSVIAFIALVTMSQAQNWKGNGSVGFGILNPKVRFQYEMPLNSKITVGANANYYFVNWKGFIIEPFARIYGKSGNNEGFFGQFKLGYGNLGVLENELIITNVKRWSTFGGGLGCGYKFLVGSHFTIEPYFGVRLYTGPSYALYNDVLDGASIGEAIGWGVTTGLPIEFNWKVGYQF
jgi:hypothetical protein